MKKVFALLLAEFRKLGANVIFANFSKIIIDTGKVDLPSAHAYCDSLLKTLQTRYCLTSFCKYVCYHLSETKCICVLGIFLSG
jgi:hypothetical protein